MCIFICDIIRGDDDNTQTRARLDLEYKCKARLIFELREFTKEGGQVVSTSVHFI